MTSADESDNADHEQESAAVDGEKEQSGRTTIADGGREIGEWANRGGMPCPHRMSAAIELVRRWAVEYDEAKEFLRGVGFREDGGGERLVTDGGQPVEDEHTLRVTIADGRKSSAQPRAKSMEGADR